MGCFNGAAPGSARMVPDARPGGRRGGASMGPRLGRRGWLDVRRVGALRDVASMGPRLGRRGWAFLPNRLLPKGIAFSLRAMVAANGRRVHDDRSNLLTTIQLPKSSSGCG